MGWRLGRLDGGYGRIVGAWYATVVAFIDDVCEAERDDYLRPFRRHEKQSLEALWWLNARCLRMTTMENEHELERYDDLRKRLLSTFKPEEVLSTFKPEEVLRHYGLEPLLSHLRNLAPAERAEIEGKLPPELREALRRYVDGTP